MKDTFLKLLLPFESKQREVLLPSFRLWQSRFSARVHKLDFVPFSSPSGQKEGDTDRARAALPSLDKGNFTAVLTTVVMSGKCGAYRPFGRARLRDF